MPFDKGHTTAYWTDPNQLCTCGHQEFQCTACGNTLDVSGKPTPLDNCIGSEYDHTLKRQVGGEDCYFDPEDMTLSGTDSLWDTHLTPAVKLAIMSTFARGTDEFKAWSKKEFAQKQAFISKVKETNNKVPHRHMLLKFRGEVGYTTCNKCPAGQYQDSTGHANCTLCAAGQFQDEEEATKCKECATGKFAAATGLSACETCNNWCPEGQEQTSCGGSLRGTGCQPCAPGSYKVQGTQKCTKCQAGTWGDESTAPLRGGTYCKACTAGRFQGDEGNSTGCEACVANAAAGLFATSYEGAAACDVDTNSASPAAVQFDVIDSSNDESLLVGWNAMTFLNRQRRACPSTCDTADVSSTHAVEPMRTFQLWNITRAKSTSNRGFCDAVLTYHVQVQFSVYGPILVEAVKAHGVYTNITFYNPLNDETKTNAFLLDGEMANGLQDLTNPCRFEDPANNIDWDPAQYLYRAMDSNALQCKRSAAYADAKEAFGLGTSGGAFHFSQPDDGDVMGFPDEKITPTVTVTTVDGETVTVDPVDVGEDSSFGFGSTGETAQAIAGMGNGAADPGAIAGEGYEAAAEAETRNYQYGDNPTVGGAAEGSKAVPVGSTASGSLFAASGGKGFGLGASPTSEGDKPPASCAVGQLQRKLRVFQNNTHGNISKLETQPFMFGLNTTINGSQVCQQLALGEPVTSDESGRRVRQAWHDNTTVAVYGKRTQGLDATVQVGYATIAGLGSSVQKDGAGTTCVGTRRLGVETASVWGFKARRRLGVTAKPPSVTTEYVANLMNLSETEYDAFVETSKVCFDIGGPKARSAAGNRTARTYLRRISPVEMEDLANGVDINGEKKHLLYEVRPQKIAIEGIMTVAGSTQYMLENGTGADFHTCLEACSGDAACKAFTHYADVTKMGKRAGHCYGSNNPHQVDTITTALYPGATSGFKQVLNNTDATVMRAMLLRRLYVKHQEDLTNNITGSMTPYQKELRTKYAAGLKGTIKAANGRQEHFQTAAKDLPKAFDPRKVHPECHTFQHIGAQRAHCNTCWAWSNAQMLSGRICVQSNGRFTDLISPEAYTNCFAEKCGDTDFQFRALSIQEFREDTKDADLADYFTLLKTKTLKEGIATNVVPYQCVDKNWDPKENPSRPGSGPKSELWPHIKDKVGFKYPGCHVGSDWHTMVSTEPLCQRKYPLIRKSSTMMRYPFQYELKTAGSWAGNEMKRYTTKLPDNIPVDVSVLGAAYYQEVGAAAIKLGAARDDLDIAVTRTKDCVNANALQRPDFCTNANTLAHAGASTKFTEMKKVRTRAFNAKVSGHSGATDIVKYTCDGYMPTRFTAETRTSEFESYTGATQPHSAESCPKNEHGIYALWNEASDDGGTTGWHLCSWHYQTANEQAELVKALAAVKQYKTCLQQAYYDDKQQRRDTPWTRVESADGMEFRMQSADGTECTLGPAKATVNETPRPGSICVGTVQGTEATFPPRCMARATSTPTTKECLAIKPWADSNVDCKKKKTEEDCKLTSACAWQDACGQHAATDCGGFVGYEVASSSCSRGKTTGFDQTTLLWAVLCDGDGTIHKLPAAALTILAHPTCEWGVPKPSCAGALARGGSGMCSRYDLDPNGPKLLTYEAAACPVELGVKSWDAKRLDYVVDIKTYSAVDEDGNQGKCMCRIISAKWKVETWAVQPALGQEKCRQFNTNDAQTGPGNPSADRRMYNCQWFTHKIEPSGLGELPYMRDGSEDGSEGEAITVKKLACASFAQRYKSDCEFKNGQCETRYGKALGPLEWIRECKNGVFIPPNYTPLRKTAVAANNDDDDDDDYTTRKVVLGQIKVANKATAGLIAQAREDTERCFAGKCMPNEDCKEDCGQGTAISNDCRKCTASCSDETAKGDCTAKADCAWVADFAAPAAPEANQCTMKTEADCKGECVFASKYGANTDERALLAVLEKRTPDGVVKTKTEDGDTYDTYKSACVSAQTSSCFNHRKETDCTTAMNPQVSGQPNCYWRDMRCRPVDQTCAVPDADKESARKCGAKTATDVYFDVCQEWSEVCVPGKCQAKGVYTEAQKYVAKCNGITTHEKCSAWPTSAYCSWDVDTNALENNTAATNACAKHAMPVVDVAEVSTNATATQEKTKATREGIKKACNSNAGSSCVWTTALADHDESLPPALQERSAALKKLSPCLWDVMHRFTNKCRPRTEECPHTCERETNPLTTKDTCQAKDCKWQEKTTSPIFNQDDWRVMDWKGSTKAVRSGYCRDFFVDHARRVTGSKDIAGVLGLFGARLEFEQENFDAYECGAENGCLDGVKKNDLAADLKKMLPDGDGEDRLSGQKFKSAEFNAAMTKAYEKSVIYSKNASQTDMIKGRKQFMEVLLSAQEELMMREIMRGGVATGLKSATLQFSTATADMMDCDCFINDDGIFVCDPAPWMPDSAHGQYADHALVLIGWGEQAGVPYWIGKNSWGTAWGDYGYFKIRRGVNSCLVELAHPVTAEPDLVSMEEQTLQLSRNLFREHSARCARCTFDNSGRMSCFGTTAAEDTERTKTCQEEFDGSTNRWDRWNCQKGGFFNPALIRSRQSCIVSDAVTKKNTKGEGGNSITASEPVDGTNLPLCATRLNKADCEAFTFTDKAGSEYSGAKGNRPCVWSKPAPQIPCTCMYPWANDDTLATANTVFATNDAYSKNEHTYTVGDKTKKHPYHENLQGCTLCAPRCANGGTVDTTDEKQPCKCKCQPGFGGDNCEDHLRVECAGNASLALSGFPMLHYHLSFPSTPGDYFTSSPGEGTFTLACERRFHLCDATEYNRKYNKNGCVCKDADLSDYDTDGWPIKRGECKHASKDCNCVHRDGAMRIDDLSSSGSVTMKYVRFFKGFTHTMADTYHTHGGDTFKVTATQCKQPAQTVCPAGTFRALGDAQCHQCPAGRFTNVTNQEKCTVCDAGESTSEEGGATGCTACDAGFTTVPQEERKDPPRPKLTRACKLEPKCTMTIAYVIGVYQNLDKGKNGDCSMYWARAVKYAVNNGACSTGDIGYQMNDARWGASDSADPMSHAWKSDAVRDCWRASSEAGDARFKSIQTRYNDFREKTKWGPLCDIAPADPGGCALGDRCLDAIGMKFMMSKKLAPDYKVPDPEVKPASPTPAFLTQLMSTQTKFATCPQFWEKQLSDVMVQTTGEWELNKTTGIWEFVSYDICPMVAAPVWRSPLYRRCWNAIRHLPFSANGQAFQTPACDPTNQCQPMGEDDWYKTAPLTGGSCLDVDGNGKNDAFDIMAIRIALTLGTGTKAQKELTAMYSRRQSTASTGAMSPAQVLTAVDICNGKSDVHYSVSSDDTAGNAFVDLDAKLLMAHVAVANMPEPAQVAIIDGVCGADGCAGGVSEARRRIRALGNEKFAGDGAWTGAQL
jgi:hypothetical protein